MIPAAFDSGGDGRRHLEDQPVMTAPSLAIIGARIRTLDPARPFASAIAASNGKIVAVGDDDEIRRLCTASTEVIDGSGMTVVPGLTDPHIHPFMGAIRSRGADLTAARDLDAIRAAIAAERERVGPGRWIVGWGATFEPFLETGIRGETFDAATGGQPCFINFFDGHSGVVNQAALDAAGIDGPRHFEEAAAIVCDADGKPTGELQESAALSLIQDAMPKPTEDEVYSWIVEAFRGFNRVGLTGLHAMDGGPETLDILRRMEERGDLTCRVVQPMWIKPDMDRSEWQHLLGFRDERGERWRCGVAKFFIDGVIESGTAWLIEPDTHGDGTLPFWPNPQDYKDAVALFAGAGHQCITHAVGDMAVRCALDAYQAAGAAPGVHHRIEHIELVDDADLPRFAAQGVVASMQPLHMFATRADRTDAWSERVGPERLRRQFRTRELKDSGAILALGSDWMVAPYDPRKGMAWAQLRREGGDVNGYVVGPEQALTPLEVLEGYTIEAARTVGESDINGRIAPGYRADLTAFAADPVDCGGDTLRTLPVLLTVTDGQIVHRAEA
jgi:predicted amidohydrolase YtcJ